MNSALLLGTFAGLSVVLSLSDPVVRRPVRRAIRQRLESTSKTSDPPSAGTVSSLRTWVATRWHLRRVDHHLLARRCLDALARSARSGDSLATALDATLQTLPDLGPWFAPVVRRGHRGVALYSALGDAPHQRWPDGMVLVHHALSVASHPDTGHSGAVRSLELSAQVAADRCAVREERRAQSAQARLSATVLIWVPLGVAVVTATADARVRHVLVATPLGLTCLLVGLALAAGGQWWIRRIVEGPSR